MSAASTTSFPIASLREDLERMLDAAGFEQIRIQPRDESREFIRDWAPGREVEEYVVSASIEAVRPARKD